MRGFYPQVAETCQLALQRIEWLKAHPDATNEESPYYSVDPTPALPTSTPTEELQQKLLDENSRMFDVSTGTYRYVVLGGPAGREAGTLLWRRQLSCYLDVQRSDGHATLTVTSSRQGVRDARLRLVHHNASHHACLHGPP